MSVIKPSASSELNNSRSQSATTGKAGHPSRRQTVAPSADEPALVRNDLDSLRRIPGVLAKVADGIITNVKLVAGIVLIMILTDDGAVLPIGVSNGGYGVYLVVTDARSGDMIAYGLLGNVRANEGQIEVTLLGLDRKEDRRTSFRLNTRTPYRIRVYTHSMDNLTTVGK